MGDNSLEQEFYFQWHITERCNLRCQHCYHESYKSTGELEFTQLKEVLAKIEQALTVWQKVGSLSLTGGEPFVRKDDLFNLIDTIDESDVIDYFDILTNGTLISPEDAKRLQQSRKLRRVQLSLESPHAGKNDATRGDGNFNKVINAIRLLKQNDLEVSIMTTITKENKSDIPTLLDLLTAEHVDTFAIERFIPEGSGLTIKNLALSKEEAHEVFEKIHEIGINEDRVRVLMYRPLFCLVDKDDPTVGAMCSVGTNALTIMHDGTLYPCRRLPIAIGNILQEGIFKAWYDSDLLWSIRQSSNLKGKCGSCELVPICRGCRAMAYYVTGDYLEEDPHCWKQPNQSTALAQILRCAR
ncbi:MAG: hypothetical protein COW32_06355 [Candidatus Aquicultor secundus]|uniref:Radical SAM core domain-containing protein n=1 Tax=Candidatus Aquicultor secundus TaxID=1973895 RepID=A0A2M7T752_9ACTN|nr:radical SAM protein [Candidatus Aquicultor secundus]NCO65816.1 radical SAM protein [Solirubrobacter sp.]PIU26928.1 MAG: hypothetical protein COT10_06080 [Candidatus Aquicultor secundus]PIW22100.1 MAG: hypothetical protein COW32_06355 [Candidatus Aquicultor secundus]PIX52814.1 MAG: hypothetical protein COZ51_02080 [Candidatus Aquicultor secundus]PIY40626.1 MAG: hypothetical protein COZ03_03715 [Candidatus Aquicultor secundus]